MTKLEMLQPVSAVTKIKFSTLTQELANYSLENHKKLSVFDVLQKNNLHLQIYLTLKRGQSLALFVFKRWSKDSFY